MSCLPCLALMGYDGPSQMGGMGAMGCGDRPCAKCAAAHAAQGMGALLEPVRFVNFGPNKTGVGGNWAGNLGLRGMGDLDEQGTVAWLTSIADGTTAREMNAWKSRLYDQRTRAQEVYNAAIALDDSDGRSSAIHAAQQAIQAANDALSQYNAAAEKYGEIVNEIQTYSFNQVQPPQLGSMGVLPYVIAGIAAIGAVAILVSQFSSLVGSFKGSGEASRGYIDQAATLVKNAGGTIEQTGDTLTKVALVGILGLGLYLIAKKKGAL